MRTLAPFKGIVVYSHSSNFTFTWRDSSIYNGVRWREMYTIPTMTYKCTYLKRPLPFLTPFPNLRPHRRSSQTAHLDFCLSTVSFPPVSIDSLKKFFLHLYNFFLSRKTSPKLGEGQTLRDVNYTCLAVVFITRIRHS